MANSLLSNKTLEDFLARLDLPKDKKATILQNIPRMDEETRIRLLKMLVDVYFLEEDKNKAVEYFQAVRNFMENPTKDNYEKVQNASEE